MTFSLLPDCLASRLSSTLAEVEEAVTRVESRDGTMVDLAAQLRPGEPDRDRVQGALRYLQRRRRGVCAALAILIGLFPDRFSGRQPRLEDFRAALDTTQALMALRTLAAEHLRNLPPPLGFGPRSISRRASARRLQQEVGADPPEQPL